MILSQEEKKRIVFPIPTLWESAPGGKNVHSEPGMLMSVGWLKVRHSSLATADILYLIADIYLIRYSNLSVYDVECGLRSPRMWVLGDPL